MIDYDKLKKAEELANKIDCILEFVIYPLGGRANLYRLMYDRASLGGFIHSQSFVEIDDLIQKLTELTQPKPKYEVGQKVWYVNKAEKLQETQILDLSVQESTIDEPFYYCCVSPIPVPESILYPTKQDLIEAQIKYWSEESVKAGLTVWTQSTTTLPSGCFNVPNQHGTTTSVSLYPPSEQSK